MAVVLEMRRIFIRGGFAGGAAGCFDGAELLHACFAFLVLAKFFREDLLLGHFHSHCWDRLCSVEKIGLKPQYANNSFRAGLKSLCENCKIRTSAAEAALIALRLCRS